MSQVMPQYTAQGYSPPSVRQFSVFLENKVGRLLDVVRMFDEAPELHLCGLSVLESSDHAVVRLIPNNGAATQQLLREHSVEWKTLRSSAVSAPTHNAGSIREGSAITMRRPTGTERSAC